jgi:hypothetical protein
MKVKMKVKENDRVGLPRRLGGFRFQRSLRSGRLRIKNQPLALASKASNQNTSAAR